MTSVFLPAAVPTAGIVGIGDLQLKEKT